MRKSGLPSIVWVLLGLLGMAACLLTLGQQDNLAEPASNSYGPSGTSALAEVLRHQGMQVETSNASNPRLLSEDVEVAFRVLDPELHIDMQEDKQMTPFETHFLEFLKQGGTGIILPLSRDFLDASRVTLKTPSRTVSTLAHREFKVTDSGLNSNEASDRLLSKVKTTSIPIWSDSKGSFLSAIQVGKGTLYLLQDGIGATNRFIDQQDNAKAYTQLFRVASKGSKRIVFAEASFGNVHNRGLLETVGPWANAAWQQLLFAGLVVAFTLGKRFGLPEEYRQPQRGSREYLDAIAETLKRTQSTRTVLKIALDQADADVRTVLKLAKDAPRIERDRQIPESLQNAFAKLLVNSDNPTVSKDHALSLILEMQKELDAFIGPNRAKLRSLAKLRA